MTLLALRLTAEREVHAATLSLMVWEKTAMQKKISICILHIGTPKTGSTAIQRFLQANYDALSRRNIIAHVKLANQLAKAFTPWHMRTRFLKKSGLQDPQQHAQLKKKAIQDLQETVSSTANDQKVVLLSSEHFYMLLSRSIDITTVKEVLERYFETVVVVCFFRDPIDFVVSSYNQSLRGAYSGSLPAFIGQYIGSGRWKYFSNYNAWSSVFGSERCFFVPFNPDQKTNYDVVRHFCALVNLDPEGLNFSQGKRFNPQMSAKLTAVYRLINIWVPLWKHGTGQQDVLNPSNFKLKRFFKRLWFIRRGSKLRLTEDQKQLVRSATYTEYRRMLEHYKAGRNALSGSTGESE